MYWKNYRAGVIDIEDIGKVNDELVPSGGVSEMPTWLATTVLML